MAKGSAFRDPAVRAVSIETRHFTKIFNTYLKRLGKSRKSASIAEIDEQLKSGCKTRQCPVFEGRERVGSAPKQVALLPADKAKLLMKREALASKGAAQPNGDVREEFLAMLPEYVKRGKASLAVLKQLVPEQDLIDAGLIEG